MYLSTRFFFGQKVSTFWRLSTVNRLPQTSSPLSPISDKTQWVRNNTHEVIRLCSIELCLNAACSDSYLRIKGTWSPSPWETKSHLVSQETSCLSWKPKFLYHIQKFPPFYNIQNHKDAVHIFTIKSIRFALILF